MDSLDVNKKELKIGDIIYVSDSDDWDLVGSIKEFSVSGEIAHVILQDDYDYGWVYCKYLKFERRDNNIIAYLSETGYVYSPDSPECGENSVGLSLEDLLEIYNTIVEIYGHKNLLYEYMIIRKALQDDPNWKDRN